MSWAKRLRNTLRFIEDHSDAITFVGLMPCETNSFLVNSQISAIFFGLKQNSLNINFRQHRFVIDSTADAVSEFAQRYPNLASLGRC
jgi:hypothetical protein